MKTHPCAGTSLPLQVEELISLLSEVRAHGSGVGGRLIHPMENEPYLR